MGSSGIFRIDPVYRCFIGTGGIGTGRFFELRGTHTLGREESRPGHFLDRRDYCKLHIVSHYVSVLMGCAVEVYPVGMVGEDEEGRRLLKEMKNAGLKLDFVKIVRGRPTLFSFCFLYPDGNGGNLTTDDSASSLVSVDYIKSTELLFKRFRNKGVVCALPEVPPEARYELLRLGRIYGFYNIASFTSDEIKWALQSDMLDYIDLVSLNSDEARVLVEIAMNDKRWKQKIFLPETALKIVSSSRKARDNPGELLKECEKIFSLFVDYVDERYPELKFTFTCGKAGSWSWDGSQAQHLYPPRVQVLGTSGAGDAFLAGVICGLFAGFSIHEAHHLGNALSAMAVTSPHTINFDITPELFIGFLREINFLKQKKLKIPESILKKLKL